MKVKGAQWVSSYTEGESAPCGLIRDLLELDVWRCARHFLSILPSSFTHALDLSHISPQVVRSLSLGYIAKGDVTECREWASSIPEVVSLMKSLEGNLVIPLRDAGGVIRFMVGLSLSRNGGYATVCEPGAAVPFSSPFPLFGLPSAATHLSRIEEAFIYEGVSATLKARSASQPHALGILLPDVELVCLPSGSFISLQQLCIGYVLQLKELGVKRFVYYGTSHPLIDYLHVAAKEMGINAYFLDPVLFRHLPGGVPQTNAKEPCHE